MSFADESVWHLDSKTLFKQNYLSLNCLITSVYLLDNAVQIGINVQDDSLYNSGAAFNALAYYSIPFLLYFADGNRYEGEFRDDNRNGQGTFYAIIEIELRRLDILILQYSSACYNIT